MRRVKLVIASVVALSLLCFFTISTASAQPLLDGLWFKLTGRATGYAVDPVTGDAMRGRFPHIGYLGFVWDGGGGPPYTYNYVVYTKQGPDVWAISSSGTCSPSFDSYFPDWEWIWQGEGGVELDFYHTAVITPTWRGLRYQGWGEVYDGDDGAGNRLYGGITITGTSIDPSRLPFVPLPPT